MEFVYKSYVLEKCDLTFLNLAFETSSCAPYTFIIYVRPVLLYIKAWNVKLWIKVECILFILWEESRVTIMF